MAAFHIADYIAATRGNRFEMGRCDCCLWPSGYVAQVTGRNPMAGLVYATAFEARAVKMAHGGIVNLTRERMAFLPPGRDVVLAKWRGEIIGGLMLDGLLFLKSARDVVMTRDFDLIHGWAV